MMLQAAEEETRLYAELDKCKDEKRRKEIRERLKEIFLEEEEKLKNCPFAH